MRVLIISTYFAPEPAGNAPYVSGVADHLAAVGHSVEVVTGYPHYPEWRPLQRRVPMRVEHRGGAVVRRRMHFVPRRPTARARAVYEGSLAVGGLIAATTTRRPDVVLAFSPALSDGLVGLAAARLHARPLAIVFQDLFSVGASESGLSSGERMTSFLRRIELGVARRAAAVGIVSDGFRDHLLRSVAGSRIHRLHNWSQLAEPTRSRAETRQQYGWRDDEIICVHGGNMGEKQGLEVVIEAAHHTGRAARFVFVGDGNRRKALESRARELRLMNVEFLGRQGDAEYANVIAAADQLLLVQRPQVKQMSLPSKLETYLAAKRPIIASVAQASEAAAVLERQRAGVVVAPGSPALLADAILRMAGTPPSRYSEPTVTRAAALAGYESLLAAALPRRHQHAITDTARAA